MFFFPGHHCQRWFSMVLLLPDYHHWMFFCRSTIDIDGFSMVFRNSGKMVNDGSGCEMTIKTCKCDISHFTTNLRNLQNNLHAPFYPFHFSSIVLASRIHDLNEDFAYILLRFKVGCCSRWTFKSSFCCHWKFAMFFRGTITIEWNGQRQPLKTMVFRWFWVSQPLVTMVFRWLATIGPRMEWLHTIVEVYNLD